MILTRKNQSIYDLTNEFITAMQKIPSGGPDGEKLCDALVELEQIEETSSADAQLEKMLHPRDKHLEVVLRLAIPLTKTCLAFCAAQSKHNPQLMTILVGYYGLKFFEYNPKSEKLNLRWIFDLVGKSKFLVPTDFNTFLWFAAAKIDDTRTVFDVITPEEFYRYDTFNQD